MKPTIEAYEKRVDDSTEKAERQDTKTKEIEKRKKAKCSKEVNNAENS